MVDYCEKRQYNEAAAALRKEGHVSDVKAPIESKEGLLFEYALLPTLFTWQFINDLDRWWICFWHIYTARVHPDKSHNKSANLYAEVCASHVLHIGNPPS
jgi:hypothetical protein